MSQSQGAPPGARLHFFWPHPQHAQVLGQGSNPCHSSNPNQSSDNTVPQPAEPPGSSTVALPSTRLPSIREGPAPANAAMGPGALELPIGLGVPHPQGVLLGASGGERLGCRPELSRDALLRPPRCRLCTAGCVPGGVGGRCGHSLPGCTPGGRVSWGGLDTHTQTKKRGQRPSPCSTLWSGGTGSIRARSQGLQGAWAPIQRPEVCLGGGGWRPGRAVTELQAPAPAAPRPARLPRGFRAAGQGNLGDL